MNTADFVPIAKAMQAQWWAFPIPPSALDGYVQDLHDLDAEAVGTAIRALATDGLAQPPTAGQIRRRVAELELDAPNWDQARAALVRWRHGRKRRLALAEGWECPAGECDGSGLAEIDHEIGKAPTVVNCSCRPARTAAIRGLDELPALLAEFVTSDHVEFSDIDRFLEQADTTTEAQVRDRFRAFVARAVSSRVLAGLPNPAGLARLEAAEDEDLPRRDPHRSSLRQFDPAALLPERAA